MVSTEAFLLFFSAGALIQGFALGDMHPTIGPLSYFHESVAVCLDQQDIDK